ncbi:hypothetical protein [Glaciecola sp. KUL10]|uniref:hypothetical protein n=1 Tax=Glaciecola sp. (strain KUL10) TaxID=2161813 RepID=UPI000D783332|nr:hypothetical protein [Glaciecola sp. KUL10]GBL05176.1 hypothetical protein KUL10_24960 [Glaciecola sp. KUL10]
MRLFFKIILGLLLILLVGGWFLFVQPNPIVKAQGSQQVENADQVLSLFHDLRFSLRYRYQAKTLKVSHKQAESLVGFVQRALPNIKAEFDFDDTKAIASFSYQLPSWLLNRYINLTAIILPGEGLQLETVRVGALTIPGKWALGIAEYAANTYTNSEIATVAIAQIDTIDMNSRNIQISLYPMDSFLNEAKKVETGGDQKEAVSRNIRIAHYIRLLDGMYIPPATGQQASPSLSHYIQGLMEEAKIRSTAEGVSATQENEAAILALAAFAGHRQFANFVGDFSFSFDVIPQAKKRPSLFDREDLSLHFIFSAAIKLLSEQGISIAVGEFKELMDRRRGGSGYSFVDLAADMAGAHFAAMAMEPNYAQRLQAVLANRANESLFFPSVEGLEEGMNKAQFKAKYGEVDSPRYKAVVADIEARLNSLPISGQ